jgi:hypothetical protein
MTKEEKELRKCLNTYAKLVGKMRKNMQQQGEIIHGAIRATNALSTILRETKAITVPCLTDAKK